MSDGDIVLVSKNPIKCYSCKDKKIILYRKKGHLYCESCFEKRVE